MLNRFYTKEFFEEIRRILKKGGLMVTGMSSTVNYIGEEVGVYSGSLYRTLHDVFDHVMVTPGDRNYFFASFEPGITTTDSGVLANRYEERGISSAFFSPALFGALLPRERLTFIEESLKSREDLTLNSDGRPITYFHHLRLWEIFSGREGGGASFYSLIPKGATWYWIALFGFLVVRVLYVSFRGRAASGVLRFNCLLAMLTTGLAGMAMEIVLIFSFQNVYGYVYQKVGLIVAFFMFGLALGGFLMNRLISRGAARWVSVLTGLEALILIYVLGLPFVLDLSSSLSFLHEGRVTLEAVFAALVAVAGFLTGVEFPLVSKIILAEGEELERAAGSVDAFDHLGACIGALLTGTVLVPVLGVFQSCALIAALKGASLVLLLFYLVQSNRTESRSMTSAVGS
jgi:spermidine synthase